MGTRSVRAFLFLVLVGLALVALPTAASAAFTPAGTITTAVPVVRVSPVGYGTVSFFVDGVKVAAVRAGFTVTEVFDDGDYDGYYSASKQVFLTDGVHALRAEQNGVVVGSSTVTVKAAPQLESSSFDGANPTVQLANNGPTMTCNFYDPSLATLVKSGGPSSSFRDAMGMYHLTFSVPLARCTKTGVGYACDVYAYSIKANEAFPTGGVSPTIMKQISVEVPTCVHWWDTSDEGVWDHEHGIGCDAP